MAQTYSDQREGYYDGGDQGLDLAHYFGIAKRRAFYFIVPFILVLLLGAFVTAIQRPIYEAKGKILVELQEIPTNLVMPTVTESAGQRIQVIQQRIMTRDNLLALVKKYGMFAREQQWMSGTELLDLMRERTKFEIVDSSSQNAIAFTVSFEYENPAITLNVTNDFLTLILAEDARSRTTRATETTEFLTHELERLQSELAAADAQIAQDQIRPSGATAELDPVKLQAAELAKLKDELVQDMAIYSDAHPRVIALKKRIAAMEQLIAKTPSAKAAQQSSGFVELEGRRLQIATALDENNKKLEAARLGEKLERDQQSERLAVIEQPVLPSRPTKPNRMKFLALTFFLAIAAGGGVVFAAESLDRSIRHSHELLGVAAGRMIVSIPYIATRTETFRRKGRTALLIGGVGAVLLAGVVGFLFFGPPIDLSGLHQFWLGHLTALSK